MEILAAILVAVCKLVACVRVNLGGAQEIEVTFVLSGTISEAHRCGVAQTDLTFTFYI
jgi:hypothetical protein